MDNFEKVKHFLMELGYDITHEEPDDQLVIIAKEDEGITNMIVDCEDSILILEQFLFEIKSESIEMYKNLLMKNREIVHGAFVIGQEGKKVMFRDTLQLETLDLEELEASLTSLTLLLNEFYDEIIAYSK
jgi:hypothetical protein